MRTATPRGFRALGQAARPEPDEAEERSWDGLDRRAMLRSAAIAALCGHHRPTARAAGGLCAAAGAARRSGAVGVGGVPLLPVALVAGSAAPLPALVAGPTVPLPAPVAGPA